MPAAFLLAALLDFHMLADSATYSGSGHEGIRMEANEEDHEPVLLSADSSLASLIRPGDSYFKFVREAGYVYTVVIDGGKLPECLDETSVDRGSCVDFEVFSRSASQAQSDEYQQRVVAFQLPTNHRHANYSRAIAVLIIRPDGTPSAPQYSYLKVRSHSILPFEVTLRVFRQRDKHFGHPLSMNENRDQALVYYSTFGHKARLGDRVATHGHDGVDISVSHQYKGRGKATAWCLEDPAVVAVADGSVIKSAYLGCATGAVVWVLHDTPVGQYTALYAHLRQLNVGIGDKVRRGEALGYLIQEPLCENGFGKHLHFEMWPSRREQWNEGYSDAASGQIDPMPVLFTN